MAAVRLFYHKVLQDDLLRPFFVDLDMARQLQKQISFMACAFGAPAEYRGKDLRTAHAGLVAERGLSERHFDAIVRHLDEALCELGVSRKLIDEVLAVLHCYRLDVLGR